MVEVPRIVIEEGFTARLTLAGTGASIVIVTEPLKVEDAAVIVTDVGVVPAVSITVATPLESVVAEELDNVATVLLNEKFTVAPDTGLFELSLTVAVIVDVLEVVIDEELAETVIVPSAAAVVIVTVVEPLKVEEVAVMETDASVVPAVSVTVAAPLESVVAEVPDKVAAVLFTEKLTVAPDTGLFELSFTVAVMVDVPEVAIDDGLAETVILPPVNPPVIVTAIVPLAVPEAAVMVTVPLAVADAVNVTAALPLEVTAVELERLP